ncbi:DUF4232 domain-containing protein [Nocardioides humilatus]|uniref:DUF4232 domain-containing protein n=1 Tax=Nocardioides humilatus TaxID=2607660 RepID=A0A5B1L7D1_9ACTN|nr:DUF4232 domain-containing protein [Nocardioides humilatus]KAA1416336.1 DUF4232 domain-containing protein [Nocardioides humilatus]
MPTDAPRRDTIAAAVTAALVVLLGVAFVVVRNHDDASTTTPTPATTRTGPAPCGHGDLVVALVEPDEARGTAYRTVTLRLTRGTEPCTVRGYPETIVLAKGRPAGVATVPDQTLGRPEQLTVLPDRSAKVTLAWSGAHYCGPVDNDAVRLWVAPDLPLELPGFGRSRCGGSEGRPPVRVGAFTYVNPRDEHGTVTGLVTLNDGPEPGTGEYAHSGEVQLVGVTDTYRTAIGATGSYDVEVPAGHYEVRVSTHQWHAGATYEAGPFDVPGGELSVINIPMPAR